MDSQPFKPERIALFTDFGNQGPYLGQVRAVLADLCIPVIELQSDAPAFNPGASAYLLSAIRRDIPTSTLYLGVIDPGVGGERDPIVAWSGGDCFVGPDNGLFSRVIEPADSQIQAITWQPEKLSSSFHGRDLFAPVVKKICLGEPVSSVPIAYKSIVGSDWPGEIPEVIYVDHYGNLVTGLRGADIDKRKVLYVAGQEIEYARTFCEAGPGELFWYIDSFGLIEVAENQGRADQRLNVTVGERLQFSGK